MFSSNLGTWIRRFLLEHLSGERNLAPNTVSSYRDVLALVVPFVSTAVKKPVDRLTIEHLSPHVVRRFLDHLEQDRRCSVATRNQRLAALHALARFIGMRSPTHIAWCTEIRAIPFKRAPSPPTTYLEKPEMDALLEAPDRRTLQGFRDYAIILFLYNTGARASEVAQLAIGDLDLASGRSVRILGKRNRVRYCPLWSSTTKALASLIERRGLEQPVFLNRRRQGITRFGIHALIRRAVEAAATRRPSLRNKQISPHTIRHTSAVHLLRAGVDVNTIRAWLGHVSLDTTHIYAEIDLEMKANAIAHCEISEQPTADTAQWRQEPGLMAFLKTL